MEKFRQSISILTILWIWLLQGCSSDLELGNNSSSIPVVHCVINLDEGNYYLSLTRTFSGNENAFFLASDSTKVFYQDPILTLEGLDDGYPIWQTEFISTPAIKEVGIFPSAVGSIFRASEELRINAPDGFFTGYNRNINSLRLLIETIETETMAFSTIEIPPRPIVVEPSKVDDNLSFYTYPRWRIVSKISEEFRHLDVAIICRYKEKGSRMENKSLKFLLFENISFDNQNDEFIKVVEPDVFFSHLANSFEASSEVEYRKFSSFDMIITFGDSHFNDYYNTYNLSEDLGRIPKGNISNGLGVFSIARSVRLNGFKFNKESMDSLVNGQFTKHLKFVVW